MGDNGEGSRPGESRTVPIDAIPDPVVGYGLSDEQVVIAETNDAFERTFDTASAGTTVRRWLRAGAGVDETTARDVCFSLAELDDVDVELGAGSDAEVPTASGYRVRTLDVPDLPDDVDGYALVSERSGDGVEVARLAKVISHDLRNPLDVANAHLRAARETGEQEHFDHLRESHERMERIIRDVLALARGENALNPADDVDVATVAADAWGSVDTETASLTVEEDLSTIRADSDRLQRLFENLFRNSVEHAQPETGTGAGTIATGEDNGDREDNGEDTGDGDGADDAGPSLHVRVGSTGDGFFVVDDGRGIPPEERTRVFDPGYSSTDGGTGLGLTIVRQIAEAHEWSVSLTTGSRGGARFEFRFGSGEGSS